MKRLICAALLSASCISTGCDPMREARLFMESEAGQKLVDKAEYKVESGNNPAVEVYQILGFGMRFLDVKAAGSFEGEVTPDERGFAPPPTEPVANKPAEVPR